MANKKLARAQIEPTLDTSEYTDGDQVATLQTLALIPGRFTQGTIASVTVLSKTQDKAALDLLIFDRSVTVAADNAAASISDADMEFCLGVISVAAVDYDDVGSTNSIATVVPAAGLPVKPNTGQNLYVAIVTRTTITYAATDLSIWFNCWAED